MKAFLIGATGATGEELLQLILKDESFHQIDIFVRSAPDFTHEKLKVHVIDFDKSEEWKALVTGDVLFSCLGTTLKAAGSKEAQWKIDYGYQYEFAKIAHENEVPNYVLVSASNASPDAFFFYSKMKGQLEEAIKALSFSKTIIFRPPTLIREDSKRTMEVLAVKVLGFLNKIGLFKSQKPMPTKVLAQAMINTLKVLEKGQHTLKEQEIVKYK